jgi:hypothetical protein
MTGAQVARFEANERVTNILVQFLHLAQGVKQHPSLGTFMSKRNAIPTSVTQ